MTTRNAPDVPDAPDANSIEAIQAQRKEFVRLEQAAIDILGPCPPDLKQSVVDIHLHDGFISRTNLIRPALTAAERSQTVRKCPLIVYIHGGSFSFDTPDFLLSPARAFASYFKAIVACPSYKLTPENPFPASVQSSWEVVSWLSDFSNLQQEMKEEGIEVDAGMGIVLAGCSAGANIAAVISGIAAAARTGDKALIEGLPNIDLPITRLYITVPHLVEPEMIPEQYTSIFRSREENSNAPIIDATALLHSAQRLKPDVYSPWYSPLNLDLSSLRQHHPSRVYIQAGDLDILRDDAVVYEQFLRDGNVCQTKIDVLSECGHVGWVSFPFPQAHTQEIKEKTLDGMAWLLNMDWDKSKLLPY